jgi:hypothetical protein
MKKPFEAISALRFHHIKSNAAPLAKGGSISLREMRGVIAAKQPTSQKIFASGSEQFKFA